MPSRKGHFYELLNIFENKTCLVSEECTALKQDAFSIEPSPYTANNHPLLGSSEMFRKMNLMPETETAWLDGMSVDPDATSLPVSYLKF